MKALQYTCRDCLSRIAEHTEKISSTSLTKKSLYNRQQRTLLDSKVPVIHDPVVPRVENKTVQRRPMRLPPMPSVGDLIRLYGLSAKQKLSQNFLLNLDITNKIVRAAGDVRGSTVIEVGSGPGGLTRSLLNAGANVIAVEKDRRFIPALEALQQAAPGKLRIVYGDMLDINEDRLVQQSGVPPGTLKLMGNLPFGVATQLMLKWLRQIHEKKDPFHHPVPMVLLFQTEVARRITAPVNTEYYSRLSVMVQRLCKTKSVFDIPGRVFVPPPKVNATCVYIEPLVKPIGESAVSMGTFEYVVRQIWQKRRKTFANAVKMLGEGTDDLLSAAGVDPNLRPQQLPVEKWVDLAYEYQKWRVASNLPPISPLDTDFDEDD